MNKNCPKCSQAMQKTIGLMALANIEKVAGPPNPSFKQIGVGLTVWPYVCRVCGYIKLYAAV